MYMGLMAAFHPSSLLLEVANICRAKVTLPHNSTVIWWVLGSLPFKDSPPCTNNSDLAIGLTVGLALQLPGRHAHPGQNPFTVLVKLISTDPGYGRRSYYRSPLLLWLPQLIFIIVQILNRKRKSGLYTCLRKTQELFRTMLPLCSILCIREFNSMWPYTAGVGRVQIRPRTCRSCQQGLEGLQREHM